MRSRLAAPSNQPCRPPHSASAAFRAGRTRERLVRSPTALQQRASALIHQQGWYPVRVGTESIMLRTALIDPRPGADQIWSLDHSTAGERFRP